MPRKKKHPYYDAPSIAIQRVVYSNGNPYVSLWSAVLQSACIGLMSSRRLVHEIRKYGFEKARDRRREDKRGSDLMTQVMTDLTWITSDSEEVYGFRWACSSVGVDPIMIRSKVLDSIA